MTTGSFSDQLHDLWRTRPLRLPQQGHVAGVAAGIGHRYCVDPVLVRVAFVVSTLFGGAGILLYVAGWLLLGKPGDQVSPAESLFGRGQSSQSSSTTVVLLVALAIGLSTIGPIGFGMGGSVFVSFALMLGGLWLLYQRQPVPPALPAGLAQPPGYPVSPFQTSSAAPTYPSQVYSPYTRLPDHYEPDSASPQNPGQNNPGQNPGQNTGTPSGPGSEPGTTSPTPPAWDPLGVAPFAWDLPEPAPAPAPEPPTSPSRGRTRFTSVVLGLAVLAAAAAAAVSAGVDSAWLTPARIGAISLAVIGAGLVLGAFLRRGSGLLLMAFPLTGFVILGSIIGPIEWDESKIGDHVWSPATTAELADRYEGRIGDFTLDLRQLELNTDRTVTLDGRIGNYSVLVPADMNVRSDCSVTIGATHCIGEDRVDGGSDGTDGPVLTVEVDSRIGEVRVQRG